MGPNHRAIEREIAARQRQEEEARERALAPERDRALAAIAIWNAELAARQPELASPTLHAALIAGCHWLHVICPACETVAEIDLRIVRRNPAMTIAQVLPSLACRHCQPKPPAAEPLQLSGTFLDLSL